LEIGNVLTGVLYVGQQSEEMSLQFHPCYVKFKIKKLKLKLKEELTNTRFRRRSPKTYSFT
jgi:hypothetical protein